MTHVPLRQVLNVPLTVTLSNDYGSRRITKDVVGLSYRKSAPGGYASASFALSRNLRLTPNELKYYSDVKIVDGRNGITMWEGRLEDPGRSADADKGEHYSITAGGGLTHAHDQVKPLIFVDRRISDTWMVGSGTNIKNADVSFGDEAVASIKVQIPRGTVVTTGTNDIAEITYQDIRATGQKLARVSFDHVWGITDGNWRMKLMTETNSGGSPGPIVNHQSWTVTQTAVGRVGDTNFNDGHNVTKIRLDRDTSNVTVTDDVTYMLVRDITVRAMLKDAFGTDIKNVSEDFEDTNFNIDMTGSWARSNTSSHAGTWSLKAATISHSQVTDQIVYIPDEVTTLQFWYRVSSEACCDKFRLFLDSTEVLAVGNLDSGWVQSAVFDVTNVTKATFRYSKDSTVSSGSDTAWIDDLVLGGTYSQEYIFAHNIVADVLGRMCPKYDPDTAIISTNNYQITQAVYPDGADAAEIFDDLMTIHPTHYWAVWEKQANDKYRFEWVPWSTLIRYEADITDGYESQSSSEELYNEVRVRYRGTLGKILTVVLTQAVPELDDAGLTRTGFIDLGDNIASLENATQVGNVFLEEHAAPLNAGRVTIARPILDKLTGRMVMPWELEPGGLMRVRGIQPYLNSLNATQFNGTTVFRFVDMEFDTDSGTATCELDSFAPSVARQLANLEHAQKSWGRKQAGGIKVPRRR